MINSLQQVGWQWRKDSTEVVLTAPLVMEDVDGVGGLPVHKDLTCAHLCHAVCAERLLRIGHVCPPC